MTRHTFKDFEHLSKHIRDEGDCWIWTAAVSSGHPQPIASYSNKTTRWHNPKDINEPIPARLLSYLMYHDLPHSPQVTIRKYVTSTCDNLLCVNPEHLKEVSAIEHLRLKTGSAHQTSASDLCAQYRMGYDQGLRTIAEFANFVDLDRKSVRNYCIGLGLIEASPLDESRACRMQELIDADVPKQEVMKELGLTPASYQNVRTMITVRREFGEEFGIAGNTFI